MSAPQENSLQNVRVEWVPESTPGTPPSNPSYSLFSDYIAAVSRQNDAGTEGQPALGFGDIAEHFRGAEEHDLAISYWIQRQLVDSSGDVGNDVSGAAQDPLAEPMVYDFQTDFPSHTVVARREVTTGGVDSAGFREFIVGLGCKPAESTLPGDAADSQPIVGEVGYAARKTRQYVIDQPADGTTITVTSTSGNDSMNVTVEDEGAGTTEDIAVGSTGAESFDNVDVVWVNAEHEGDINIEDDAGNELLPEPLVGTNQDGIESERGIPPLGTGSHASAIGTDPSQYQFLGTSFTYGGSGDLAPSANDDRIHAGDLTVSCDVSREPIPGTRKQAIDVGGPRTAEFAADVAGPRETAVQNYRYHAGINKDISYQIGPTATGTLITVKNTQYVDTDDVERNAGDTNQIYGVTLEGHGDPGIVVTQA